jgi:hypothetical protein
MSRFTSSTVEVDLDAENRESSAVIYSPLSPSCIRTLRILPPGGNPSDVIECTLVEMPLSQPSPYKALSYTWGSKANPGTIKLNGKAFLVTQNLLQAITHLQAMGIDDAVWIDALCKCH